MFAIPFDGISVSDISDLSNPNEDFMNSLNTALGGSSENQIYGVSFINNANGGVDILYSIDLNLGSAVSANGFSDVLSNAIQAEPGLEPLFRKIILYCVLHDHTPVILKVIQYAPLPPRTCVFLLALDNNAPCPGFWYRKFSSFPIGNLADNNACAKCSRQTYVLRGREWGVEKFAENPFAEKSYLKKILRKHSKNDYFGGEGKLFSDRCLFLS